MWDQLEELHIDVDPSRAAGTNNTPGVGCPGAEIRKRYDEHLPA